MKITVETYHNVDIYFDTEEELFGCTIKTDSKNSKSFNSIKTWIREYEKLNSTFEPFCAINNPAQNYGHGNEKRIEIIGVNQDGYYVYLSKKTGRKTQLDKYDSERWIVEVPELEKEMGVLAILQSDEDDAIKKRREQEKKIESMSKTLKQLNSAYGK